MAARSTPLETDRPAWRVTREGNVVRMEGVLGVRDGAAIWRELRAATDAASADGAAPVEIDLSGVRSIDGAVMALVVELRTELGARGATIDLASANERVSALADLYGASEAPTKKKKRRPESAIAQVGRVTLEYLGELKAVLGFFGEMIIAVGRIVRRPRSGHLSEVPTLAEKSGAEAVFIVALINFLVGFVMAYQSARQLKMYGANIYVADLVGISLARELAPLMTAIIVTGRSGAAFAAEIGSMKVSEEIDAIRTLGLAPFGWLVVPRVIALVIVTPVLTLLGDFVGIAGGAVVATTSLDITLRGYLTETQSAVVLWDVATGLIKSIVFAITVGLIACQQGFAASGGAESVGRRTTSTVVLSLFTLVILDAFLTVVFRAFNV